MTQHILYTIGYSGRDIGSFIDILQNNHIQAVIDVRRWVSSRYKPDFSGKSLRKTLPLHGIAYVWKKELSPSVELLEGYKNKTISWNNYETCFISDLRKQSLFPICVGLQALGRTCLLCSEASPEHCHRRLLAEEFVKFCSYTNEFWTEIKHL